MSNFRFVRHMELKNMPKNVWIMSYTTAIFVISIFIWNRLVPIYLRELGATDFQVSLAFSLLAVALGIGQFPGGIWADKLGRKPLVVIPTYIAGVLYFIGGFVHTWYAFVLILILVNISSSIQGPGFVSIMAEAVEPRKRGSAFGLFQFFIGLSLALGPAIGAILLPYFSIPTMVAFTGVVGLIIGIWRQKSLVETKAENSLKKFKYREIFKGELLLLLFIGTFFTSISNLTIYGPFIPLYSIDILGLSKKEINLLFAVGPFIAMAVSLIAGKLIEIWGQRKVMIAGIIGTNLFILIWLIKGGFALALITFSLAYFCFQGAAIAYDTLRTEISSHYSAGAVLGALGTVSGLISAGAAPIASALIPYLGPQFPFYFAAVLGLGTVICVNQLKSYDRTQAKSL
ncbi:hypothetical protein BBF96_13955 [Anoxybacter fermentans]|uniref:Major facilitator superfamily (MFS) profile domain-containing protein n=1 Tax=Anoxybacter fermentans TaxID=1323375 RepID=A0A3Q9HRZ9_9FIRM|nr:MFS transporter [Anoxybacter fermentans]AZR74393.1 hypothetical protein BBF96_13955 [Anoxybacter fermentans]